MATLRHQKIWHHWIAKVEQFFGLCPSIARKQLDHHSIRIASGRFIALSLSLCVCEYLRRSMFHIVHFFSVWCVQLRTGVTTQSPTGVYHSREMYWENLQSLHFLNKGWEMIRDEIKSFVISSIFTFQSPFDSIVFLVRVDEMIAANWLLFSEIFSWRVIFTS